MHMEINDDKPIIAKCDKGQKAFPSSNSRKGDKNLFFAVLLRRRLVPSPRSVFLSARQKSRPRGVNVLFCLLKIKFHEK